MPERRAEPTEAEKNVMAATHPGLYKPGCGAFLVPVLLVAVIVLGGLLGGWTLWIIGPAIAAAVVVWGLFHFGRKTAKS
ncbi:MAG: hypothetical protein ACJ74J_05505 [Blastocatellia bacterium]